MDLLKKYWPLGFKAKKGDVVSLVVWLIVGVVFCALIGWVTGLVAGILTSILPILGVFTWIIGVALDIYGIVNIVLCILSFLGKV